MKAIRVDNLSKSYQIGYSPKGSLRHTLGQWIKFQAFLPTQTFWALKEVSFDIEQGTSLGIIGPNGSGKSTLLKLLARITKPSQGQIEINGSLSAMLEVGAGFHPELTGKENIFLNGSILGMSKQDVRDQLDQIIAFAELERMIDNPVKFYSSGMYVRLAFAVGAFLRSDILLLDEILAVGDAGFQRKCLDLLEKRQKETGKTVLFVSHDLGVIEELCQKAIQLDGGRITENGTASEVVRKYLIKSLKRDQTDKSILRVGGGGPIQIAEANLEEQSVNGAYNTISCGSNCNLKITIHNPSDNTYNKVALEVGLNAPTGQRISHISTKLHTKELMCPPHSKLVLNFSIPKLPLMPGLYSWNMQLAHEFGLSDWIKNSFHFYIKPGAFYPSGALPPAAQTVFLIDHKMTSETFPE